MAETETTLRVKYFTKIKDLSKSSANTDAIFTSDVTSCSPAMIGVGGPASEAGGEEYGLDRKEPALVN